jgi:hypothetical protein
MVTLSFAVLPYTATLLLDTMMFPPALSKNILTANAEPEQIRVMISEATAHRMD